MALGLRPAAGDGRRAMVQLSEFFRRRRMMCQLRLRASHVQFTELCRCMVRAHRLSAAVEEPTRLFGCVCVVQRMAAAVNGARFMVKYSLHHACVDPETGPLSSPLHVEARTRSC